MKNVRVTMLRESAQPTLQFDLPPEYRFRPFRSGDETTWTAIQRAAEPFLTIDDKLFGEQFGAHPEALPERMLFVESAADGAAIGTITAWWKPGWRDGREWGQIHWVAIMPAHQGKGLSKPMMTRAMNLLLKYHVRAMLSTSTGRLYAIKVYLDFGFVPAPEDLAQPETRAAWQAVSRNLNHPLLNSLSS
ncbi:MAG: GNAT family N-acetyltransferase [Planctomycetota bacterium]